VSSSLHSAPAADVRDELRRRFVEAARRAQIVTIVNQARTEAELGDLVTAELCEAFEAEIAFLAVEGEGRQRLVGAHGLPADEGGLLDVSLLDPDAPALRTLGAQAVACASFGASPSRGVVAVARLYDEPFDPAEVALLEAAAVSIHHALERLRLADERDRLYREEHERAQAARVLGSIADGVLLVDDAGIVQLWNPAAEAITGLARARVLGRPLVEAIPGWPALEDMLAAGAPAASAARRATVPVDVGGPELWLSITAVGVDGGCVYAFRDLTEERRLEQLKADFIATVSHELRTPIAAVLGAVQTLQREDVDIPDELAGQLLSLVRQQADRLARMVDDILLASRVDAPELVVATDRVDDLAELAAEVVAAARAHAADRLTLDLVAPPSLPPVAADRDKLRQVLTNLVGNAVKYSPHGGRIEIALVPGERRLDIAVRDEGVGISPADQALVFEKFFRVDPNMARGVSGSGLGLYITRKLVHRMDGRITVESELGRGSTFVVTLPLADVSVA
jgi:PAS domain S-box-containing protein